GYNGQLAALDDEQAALEKERQKLADEFVADGTSDARKTEIQTRLEEITTRLAEGIPTDREAVNAERDALKLQMAEATLKGYDPEKPNRLETVNWVSSLHNFVFTTLKSGRPTSSSYWDKAMPAWSQQGGGPLRDDQLEDLVVYVLNWDKGADWTLEDLLLVQQFAREPGLGAAAADDIVVTNPIDPALTYVNGSASGADMDVDFSVDGGMSFAGPELLRVPGEQGDRRAEPEDYTHIRWTLVGALDVGETGVAQFAATVK
ncbi:MAG: hypothetical protein JJ992_04945, partial [Planctomycetes bacterium]|nr:hypothetical protein [Planctomycetota bacterium]